MKEEKKRTLPLFIRSNDFKGLFKGQNSTLMTKSPKRKGKYW